MANGGPSPKRQGKWLSIFILAGMAGPLSVFGYDVLSMALPADAAMLMRSLWERIWTLGWLSWPYLLAWGLHFAFRQSVAYSVGAVLFVIVGAAFYATSAGVFELQSGIVWLILIPHAQGAALLLLAVVSWIECGIRKTGTGH